MSKTEHSDLTAEKDAPPVEVTKTDCADNTVIIIAVKSTNVMREDPLAPAEVAKEVLNAQFENKCLIEAKIDTNVFEEKEVDNPDRYIKETTDIITHIPAHVSVKDVTQIETQSYAESEETLQKFINEEKADLSKQNARDDIAVYISRLEAEVRKRTKERDIYQKKFEDAKTKLTTLQAHYSANRGNDEDILHQSKEQLREQMMQPALIYEEHNRMIANQENQINALNNQVASLKEVVSITRDLLEIRNIEVKQLQAEIDNMEKKISEERDWHNTMISKMDAAIRLNADLKKEYETQLFLFQNLREKYNKKITLLSREKQILETVASTPK